MWIIIRSITTGQGNTLAQTRKHWDEVQGLPYSDDVKSYIAANLEFEASLDWLKANSLSDYMVALQNIPAKKAVKAAKEILKTKAVLYDILARHTGKSAEQIAQDSQRDFFI